MNMLTLRQVAERLQLSTSTVRSIILSGDLKAVRTRGDSGVFRVSEAALADYLIKIAEARRERK